MTNQYAHIANLYHKKIKHDLDQKKINLELIKRPGIKMLDNKSILDLGCGSGIHTKYLATKFPKVKSIVGMDNSREFIKIAKEVNSDKLITYTLGSMDRIPAKSNSFDLIYSRYTLHYSKNLAKTLKEIYRVTKPNGILFFQDVHPTYTLFFKKSKNYATKEILSMPIQGSKIKVTHPSFTIQEYVNAITKNSWKLLELKEYFGARSKIKNYQVPTIITFKLQK